MKKSLITIAFSTCLASIGCFAADNSHNINIGIINPIMVYQDTPQGEQNIQNLQTKIAPEANALQKEQNYLVAKTRELQKNSPIMTKNKFEVQRNQLKQEQELFKQKIVQFRKKELQQEQRINQEFQSDFNEAITAVAKSDGYQMIISTQALAYVSPELNTYVTKEVINKMKNN